MKPNLLLAAFAYAISQVALQPKTQAQAINVQTASPYKYKVAQRLQFLGGFYRFVPSISPQGTVAGTFSNLGKTREAGIYFQNRYTRIGTGWAVAISDYDVVAGEISVPGKDGIPRFQAALFSKGRVTEVANAGGYNESIVGGINDAGDVVGNFNYYDSTGNGKGTLGFLYQNGQLTLLNNPIPNQKESSAFAINNSGLIVGGAVFPNGNIHPAIYSGGQWHDIGVIGRPGAFGGATSVNNQGWVTGFFEYSGNERNGCFLYKDGKMVDLHLPNASPQTPLVGNINDDGQIVATAPETKENGYGQAAYVYDQGQWKQIDTLLDPNQHWSIVTAYQISNTGAIVAQGIQTSSNGRESYNGTVLIEPLD